MAKEKIEIFSIDYLLGNVPSSIFRNGFLAIVAVFLLFLAMSFWIEYPDIIEAKAVISSGNSVTQITAKQSGSLPVFLVNDNEEVVEKQVLAVLDSTANWQDVLRLEEFLAQNKLEEITENLKIGALQNDFDVFLQNNNKNDGKKTQNTPTPKIAKIKEEIVELNRLNENLESQMRLCEKTLRIIELEYARQKTLFTANKTNVTDLEKTNYRILEQQKLIIQHKENISYNRLEIKKLESKIIDLQQVKNNDNPPTFEEEKQKLLTAIALWKNNYLITAPIAGKVVFSKKITNQNFINAGDEVLSIAPTGATNQNFAKLYLTSDDAEKIVIGNEVSITLDNFTSKKSDELQGGKVTSIILLAQAENQQKEFQIEATFPDSTIFFLQNNFSNKQEIIGKAKIMTANRSVFSRIFK